MAAVSQAASPAVVDDNYADVVVLFGAHWCAPCMGEVQRLPELVAAASPYHVLLAWIDRPLASPPPARLASLSSEVARHLARSIAGDGYGLPFSVMFDAHGNPCAIQRSPLKEAEIVEMRSRCALTAGERHARR